VTEEEYRLALAKIDKLMDATGASEIEELKRLAALVEDYEAEND